MAKLVFGMDPSLDGFIDHAAFAPSPALFQMIVRPTGDPRAPRRTVTF